jgi:hypothetical protein
MSEHGISHRVWYYLDSGQNELLMIESEIVRMFESGSLPPDTLVWTEGMTEWQEARTIENLVPMRPLLTREFNPVKRVKTLAWWSFSIVGGAIGFSLALREIPVRSFDTSGQILANASLSVFAAVLSFLAAAHLTTAIGDELGKSTDVRRKVLTVLALAALLYVWHRDSDRQKQEKVIWEQQSNFEKQYVPDYVPLAVNFLLVGCCYAGLMFVLKPTKQPSVRSNDGN